MSRLPGRLQGGARHDVFQISEGFALKTKWRPKFGMQFSLHEPRNVAERFVSFRKLHQGPFFYVGHFPVTFNDYPTQATEPRALKSRDHRAAASSHPSTIVMSGQYLA